MAIKTQVSTYEVGQDIASDFIVKVYQVLHLIASILPYAFCLLPLLVFFSFLSLTKCKM